MAAAFAAFPDAERAGLMRLRALILAIAEETDGVGPLTETLKWGQPSYLTTKTQAGTTIRLGCPKTGGYALYVHCQTTLIADFRALFPDALVYEGNRAVLFDVDGELPVASLSLLIRRALTYHLA